MDKGTETVTLNIEPFLMPFAIIISSLILSLGFFLGMGNFNGKVGSTTTTTTATADTTTTGDSTATAALDIAKVKALFTSDYITFGNPDSDLLFVEVSDASCPYCHIASGKNPELNKSAGAQFTLVADGGTYIAPVPEMKKLVDEGKAAFTWLYTNGHGNGELATQAFYCAHEKGKFWGVHDLLMSASGYSILNDNVKNDLAKTGELANFLSGAIDPNEMKGCLDSGKYAGRIASDKAVAVSLGVQGTPGFFVNTKTFPGAYNWTDMKSAAGL